MKNTEMDIRSFSLEYKKLPIRDKQLTTAHLVIHGQEVIAYLISQIKDNPGWSPEFMPILQMRLDFISKLMETSLEHKEYTEEKATYL